MSADSAYCLVLTTTDAADKAGLLAQQIVASKLAACVQIQQIQSHYMWQEKACNATEFLLMIKARTAHYAALETFIHAHHTYTTPEIVQIPITAGFPGYLAWIDEVTGAQKTSGG